ncbi:TPA: SAP domain-containing protein [Streptococcus suis]|uniref:SAP domain-containing protein n=1 Tax=Streptococcus suis TaxID=1307 RepID=UPI0014792A23|nr:SAP domain-containing protein [Streptococcus suis]MCQ9226848.1 SAP domain-containing protein [Streptococcus suis]MCQ9229236.1 SAP domain-containing protein [Streptococcus suis]MCQ9243334.1 SAP domain-containing protein [Streptococcus suis]MCQ9275594.1 SAP domain-containing protein [Streptococcus suis]MDE7534116.1 SAP domain-containing protein [Streptococcus suis]
MGLLNFSFGKKKKTYTQNKGEYPVNSNQSTLEIKPFYNAKLECGLTPGQLILIDWTNKTGRSENFPGYFKYTFGIDAKREQEKLLNNGYFEFFKTLKPLKVPELKSILIAHQLPTTGKKENLSRRITENIDLNSLEIPVSYILTDKSKDILNKNDGYVRSYHDKYFDMESYHAYKNELAFNGGYGDIKWAYLNDESIKNTLAGDYGLLRNTKFAQYHQLFDENKIVDSFSFIIEVFLMDVSGLDNGYNYDRKPYYDNIFVNTNILNKIQVIGDQLDQDDFEFAFDRACWIISNLPANHFLTNDDYSFLKENILSATTEKIEKYFEKYSKFKRRLE